MQVTGNTKIVGLIGYPVEHSRSPVMQNAAFKAAGLNFIYIPLAVKPQDLQIALNGLKALGFVGVNVTIPHKVNVIPYLDRLDISAQLTGAVNTIVFKDECVGYNTDMGGFLRSLNGIKLAGKKAVVLGTGGAARAVVAGLTGEGVSVIVAGRDKLKADSFKPLGAVPLSWEIPEYDAVLEECDLLINATSLGMYPNQDAEPPVSWDKVKKAIAIDLVYNPRLTRFLQKAKEKGLKTVSGELMLIEQGVLAFELFTGSSAPRKIMYETFGLDLSQLF